MFEEIKQIMSAMVKERMYDAMADHVAKAVAALEHAGFSRDEAIRIATADNFKISK